MQLIPLTTHSDERGFFREVLRREQCCFAQWSHSMMYAGTIKAWHLHEKQYDFWYVVGGVVKAALCDLRLLGNTTQERIANLEAVDLAELDFEEVLLGDGQPPQVLVIPPGIAHGLKVLQGPAHLLYITTEEYDGTDEGRIPFDALGYDWLKQDIK